MRACRFVVPGKPRGKASPRGGATHFYVDSKTAAEMEAIRYVAARAMEGATPFQGAIDLRLCAWMPIPSSWSKKKQASALSGAIRPTVKPDWDNIGKLCDALKGIVWRDDAQVTDVHLFKRYSDMPRVVTEVYEVDG